MQYTGRITIVSSSVVLQSRKTKKPKESGEDRREAKIRRMGGCCRTRSSADNLKRLF